MRVFSAVRYKKEKRSMKQMKLLAGTLGVAAIVAAQSALGAGFGIYEGSARGNAMGGEVTADPASPSVLYNNAAGMTDLEGTQVEVGVTLIKPRATVSTATPAGGTKTYADSSWWVPPNVYATYQVNDKVWAGIGVFSRFGLGVDYPDGWNGRYNVREVTIQSLDINPSVAYKVNDQLSLAAGLRAEWFDFDLKSAIPTGTPFVDPDLDFHMKGDSWGIGYNLGAYYKATESVSIGLAYDSEIKQDVSGTYSLPTPMATLSGNGNGDITTPGIIRLGTSVQATEKLLVNAGVVYTLWSAYDELGINFSPALPPGADGIPVNESVTEKNWHDAFRWQLGAEYALNEEWDLRAGYTHDRTPIPDDRVDYLVPSNNRNLFSLGVGYEKDNFFADVSYTYLLIEDRDVEARADDGVLPGEFSDGDAHMIGLSVGYRM